MAKMTTEQRLEAVRRFVQGEKLKVIAADYGVSASYVSHLAAEAGAARRNRPKVLCVPRMKPVEASVLAGYRRLASGKVIKYVPPSAYPPDPNARP